jgi:hypothetical protein
MFYSVCLFRISKVYNDAAEKTQRPGRMYGLEGDIRLKVDLCLNLTQSAQLISFVDRSYSSGTRGWQKGEAYNMLLQQCRDCRPFFPKTYREHCRRLRRIIFR